MVNAAFPKLLKFVLGAAEQMWKSIIYPIWGRNRGQVLSVLGDKTILFVEDDPASLEALAQMGEALGARFVVKASSGEDAKNSLRYEHIDLVITDLHMRGGSGPDLIEAIRAGNVGEDNKDTPIIVLSGDNRSGVRDQLAALGVQGFVFKPVRLDELQDAMTKALS